MTTESPRSLNRVVLGAALLMALAPLAYLSLTYDQWPALQSGQPAQPAANRAQISDTIAAAGVFETFEQVLQAAGLDQVAPAGEAVTVLAPTNAAFDRLPEGRLESLLGSPEAAAALVSRHVLDGRYTAEALVGGAEARNLAGEPVNIQSGNRVTANGAELTRMNLVEGRDVLHAVDSLVAVR